MMKLYLHVIVGSDVNLSVDFILEAIETVQADWQR